MNKNMVCYKPDTCTMSSKRPNIVGKHFCCFFYLSYIIVFNNEISTRLTQYKILDLTNVLFMT